jgi:ferrous iron transport protein A
MVYLIKNYKSPMLTRGDSKLMPSITLDKLVPGESGKVIRIHGRGPVRRRLVDMGFSHGAVIDMFKTSPLGDPVEYRLRGYHLSLRKSEAETIEVELLADSQPELEFPSYSRSGFPLARAKSGQQVAIVQIRGGRGLASRLKNMDLEPGTVLHVVMNDFPGPIILSANGGNRLEIGKGIARHILVQSCD